jgi:hypothetical protein
MPHVEITTTTGEAFSYASIWQRLNLVLVTLPSGAAGDTGGTDDAYGRELAARRLDFDARASACVITRDAVPGLPAPGALVADRWGEIVYVTTAATPDGLPSAEQLFEWLDYLAQQCPECEGEVK